MKRSRMGEFYHYARPALPDEPLTDGLPEE